MVDINNTVDTVDINSSSMVVRRTQWAQQWVLRVVYLVVRSTAAAVAVAVAVA